jgi:glutaredoxin-like protein NrdH
MTDVIVYTLPNCAQCESTKRLMLSHDIEFTELPLQDHPDKVEEFLEQGHRTAPIVTTGTKIWSGFRFEEIKALAQHLHSERAKGVDTGQSEQ